MVDEILESLILEDFLENVMSLFLSSCLLPLVFAEDRLD
jgi:hypothetical protein